MMIYTFSSPFKYHYNIGMLYHSILITLYVTKFTIFTKLCVNYVINKEKETRSLQKFAIGTTGIIFFVYA